MKMLGEERENSRGLWEFQPNSFNFFFEEAKSSPEHDGRCFPQLCIVGAEKEETCIDLRLHVGIWRWGQNY